MYLKDKTQEQCEEGRLHVKVVPVFDEKTLYT